MHRVAWDPEIESQVKHLKDVEKKLEEARKDAQDLRAQIESEARERADESVERSKREVEQVFHKAWDELVKDAANVATEAASQIIQKELSPEGHAAIVSGVVSELVSREQRGSDLSWQKQRESGEGDA